MPTYNPASKVVIGTALDADPASNKPKLIVWDFTRNVLQYIDTETGNVEKELGLGDVSVESGSFQRLAGEGSGQYTINTVKRPKLIFINAMNSGDNKITSDGRSDGTVNNCTRQTLNDFAYNYGDDQFDCLAILHQSELSVEGYVAEINTINDASFVMNFTALPSGGLDIDVQWQAITGIAPLQ